MKHTAALIVCVLLASILASCVFEPRDSEEPPPDSGGGGYVLPQEPKTVISNMKTIMERGESANYPDLFSEDFYFVPDPDDVITLENVYGPGIFDSWYKNVETGVMDRLFDRQTWANLRLPDSTETVREDTDSTYSVQYDYRLEILEEHWTIYQGTVIFRMRRDPSDNLWYIFRWDDFRTGASEAEGVEGTWGILKGEIRATT
jgi:hypothetical protein